MHSSRIQEPYVISDEVRAAIDEATGVGNGERVLFAADIGNAGVDEVEWVLLKGRQKRKVTIPRAAFTYEREPGRNFWLVEMAAGLARVFKIEDFVLDEIEVRQHRERMTARKDGLDKTTTGEKS